MSYNGTISSINEGPKEVSAGGNFERIVVGVLDENFQPLANTEKMFLGPVTQCEEGNHADGVEL